MKTLTDKITRLRRTRIAMRAAIDAAYKEMDPGYRMQKLQAATLALASTEDAWKELMAQKAARDDRVDLAQLRHQASTPVRRSVPNYITRDLKPGR
jgi:hypothetical protein